MEDDDVYDDLFADFEASARVEEENAPTQAAAPTILSDFTGAGAGTAAAPAVAALDVFGSGVSEMMDKLGEKRPRSDIAPSVTTKASSSSVKRPYSALLQSALFHSLFTTERALQLATPQIVNCLGCMHLGVGVDLRALSCSVRNVEYTCQRTPRAVLRLFSPKCTAQISPSGVVTILGAPSIHATRAAAELTARIIRCALHIDALTAVKFRLRSLMARFDLQRPVRIAELAHMNPGTAFYEPETFCACTVRLEGTLFSEVDAAVEATPSQVPPTAGGVGQLPVPSAAVAAPQPTHDDFDDFDDFDLKPAAPSTQPAAATALWGGPASTTSSSPQPASVASGLAPPAAAGGKVVKPVAGGVGAAQAMTAVRWRVVANVFVSGKVVITGAKTIEQIEAAYLMLLTMLKPFMKC